MAKRPSGFLLAMVAALALGTGRGANAGPVLSFAFSGTVESGSGVLSTLSGKSITGTFSYDAGASATSITPTFVQYATGDFQYIVGANAFSYTSHPATTHTSVFYQYLGTTTGLDIEDIHLTSISNISLEQPLNVLSSTSLPNPLPASSAFGSLSVDYFDTSSDSGFSAKITQFTPLASVPEPSSLCPLAVGALGIMAYRWRTRRQARA